MAPVLAAGCPVIHKPAAPRRFVPSQLAEAVDEAGLPPGLSSWCWASPRESGRDAGKPHLPQDIVHRLHRGRPAVHRRRGRQITKLSLELGGHAPLLVFADADLGSGRRRERFSPSTAIRASRALPPTGPMSSGAIYDRFLERLVTAVKKLKVGDGLKKASKSGR